MVGYLADGRLLFRIRAPGASRVELVGAFNGWQDQRIPMTRSFDGQWQIAVDPGPGSYLFRYLVNGRRWMLDPRAHGVQRTMDGRLKNRAWCPPRRHDPDHLAA